MGQEQNIVAVASTGEKCFWCEKEIAKGDRCVRVSFAVKGPLGIGLGAYSEFAHARCAIDTGEHLRRVGETIVGPTTPTWERKK
jgi:hypothetical protein